jgi:biotin synthase
MIGTLDFNALADKVLAGGEITRDEAREVLAVPDEQVPALLSAVFRVRERTFGKRVKICVLQNARSGLCPEDCHYCSQSKVSKADIEKYPLLEADELLAGAKRAFEAGAKRYCMVTSGRGPSDQDIDFFCAVTRRIKEQYPLEICVSLGIASEEQARALKAAGVGWVNHNLNTSERYHEQICTTHTYQDRVRTVQHVQKAGLMTCSGGIVGMGENDEDIIELAFACRALQMDSIPVNFLYPVKGTPFETFRYLSPLRCLRVLALFRFINPTSEIRAAGGREINLRSLQPLALYAANSIFVEGYLTTPGQQADAAHQMIRDLGFEVES